MAKVRCKFILPVVMSVVFLASGLVEHDHWMVWSTGRTSKFEKYYDLTLYRGPAEPQDIQDAQWGERWTNLTEKIVILCTFPAVLLSIATVLPITGKLGIDQVFPFYAATTAYTFMFWYFIGWLIDRNRNRAPDRT